MIHIISRDLPKRRLHRHRADIYSGTNYARMLARIAMANALVGPRVLRALVLVLVVLLVIFVGLMPLTGHYEAGAPVLGSILLIGLGASHHAR